MFLFYFLLFINSSESSSSEESEFSSDSNTSPSFFSKSFVGSSYSDLSSCDEDTGDNKIEECIVISSDEDSMEYEPTLTPSAPLTPGAQLDLDLQDWCDSLCTEETAENQYTSCQLDICDVDAIMELQTSEPQDLHAPSPIGLPGCTACSS